MPVAVTVAWLSARVLRRIQPHGGVVPALCPAGMGHPSVRVVPPTAVRAFPTSDWWSVVLATVVAAVAHEEFPQLALFRERVGAIVLPMAASSCITLTLFRERGLVVMSPTTAWCASLKWSLLGAWCSHDPSVP